MLELKQWSKLPEEGFNFEICLKCAEFTKVFLYD